jgi:hypothetical protein
VGCWLGTGQSHGAVLVQSVSHQTKTKQPLRPPAHPRIRRDGDKKRREKKTTAAAGSIRGRRVPCTPGGGELPSPSRVHWQVMVHADKAHSFLTPVVPFRDFTVQTGILQDEVNSTTASGGSMDNETN